MAKLELLRSEPKFVDAPGTICKGMRPEDIRQRAKNQLNDLIDRLMHDPGDVPKLLLSRRQRKGGTVLSSKCVTRAVQS
jgi:hypothetical protein